MHVSPNASFHDQLQDALDKNNDHVCILGSAVGGVEEQDACSQSLLLEAAKF